MRDKRGGSSGKKKIYSQIGDNRKDLDLLPQIFIGNVYDLELMRAVQLNYDHTHVSVSMDTEYVHYYIILKSSTRRS